MLEPSNKRRAILLSIIVGAIAGAVVGIGPSWPELLLMLSGVPGLLARLFAGEGGALGELASPLYWTLLGFALFSFQWGLLGAAVGGATAWLLFRLNLRSWAIFSAVLAASSLAVGVPAGRGWWWGFHIRDVSVRAEPSGDAGPSGLRPEGRWTLRVPQAWRSDEIEAYGPEGTALRRAEPGKAWLEVLIEIAAPSASAGLTFGEMAVVDEAGVSHTALAIAGPAPEGLLRPRFLFLEEAFKPWQDPIRPSTRSTWLYSYAAGQRSEISYMDSERRLVFGVTRAGRVKILSEQPARMFLLFAPPADAKQFELRLGERARAAVDRLSTPDWTSAALAPRAGRSAAERKKDEERNKAQIAGWAQACDAGGAQACYALGLHYRSGKEYGREVPQDHLARAAAAFQKACDGGQGATACRTLGDMYRDGQGVPKDEARAVAFYKKGCEADDVESFKYQACWLLAKYGPEELNRAFTLYEEACDARDATACYTLGVLYGGTLGAVANRLGEGRSHVRADALFQKACDAGDAMACYTFGGRIRVRTGVPKYMETTVASFQKACDGGIHLACTDLGEMYRSGQGVRKDEARAADFLKKGKVLRYKEDCDGGIIEGCTSLGAMYSRGEAVPKDPARAVALLQQACDSGAPESCAVLGVLYERGTGVPKDLTRAAALQKQACEEEHIGGCRNLGVMYRDGLGVPKDPVRAASIFKQTCERWEGLCTDLGYMYEHGQGVPQDLARAAELYKKGCDGRDEWGCAYLGWMYFNGTGVPKDEARSVPLFTRGCDAGNAWACSVLGLAYFRGAGVPRDPPRAAILYKQGCDGGQATACGNLGTMYRYGQGIPKDDARALALFQEACRGGYAPACQELKRQ